MDVDALARPRFKSCIEPIIDSDDGLFVFSEDRQAWLPDPIFIALAPLLDGDHDVEAIFEVLSDRYPASRILAALDQLKAGGYLAEDAAADARPTMAFWEHAGVPPPRHNRGSISARCQSVLWAMSTSASLRICSLGMA